MLTPDPPVQREGERLWEAALWKGSSLCLSPTGWELGN